MPASEVGSLVAGQVAGQLVGDQPADEAAAPYYNDLSAERSPDLDGFLWKP